MALYMVLETIPLHMWGSGEFALPQHGAVSVLVVGFADITSATMSNSARAEQILDENASRQPATRLIFYVYFRIVVTFDILFVVSFCVFATLCLRSGSL